MSRTVAVIGAGIGGLAAAIPLQRAGWEVVVHERAATLPDTGTALGIWPAALRALDELGLGSAARDLGPAPTATTFHRADGRRIASIGQDSSRARTGDALRMLTRPALLGLLAGALAPGTVRFGSTVTDLPDAEVVIGADGLGSEIRRVLFGPRHRARYTGSMAWRGSADGPTPAISETWGDGALFGSTPREGNRTNWYASVPTPETRTAPDVDLAWLHASFGDWHPGVQRVLGAIDEASVLRHGLYHLDPPLPSYVVGRVALIGDAAHAMSPVLGRGGCEALLDGLNLAGNLIGRPTVEAALSAYDAARRVPTQRLARVAAMTARLVQARRFTGLRDVAMKLILPRAPLD